MTFLSFLASSVASLDTGSILWNVWHGKIWGFVEAIHRADGLWPLIGVGSFSLFIFALFWGLNCTLRVWEAVQGAWSIGVRRANFRYK